MHTFRSLSSAAKKEKTNGCKLLIGDDLLKWNQMLICPFKTLEWGSELLFPSCGVLPMRLPHFCFGQSDFLGKYFRIFKNPLCLLNEAKFFILVLSISSWVLLLSLMTINILTVSIQRGTLYIEGDPTSRLCMVLCLFCSPCSFGNPKEVQAIVCSVEWWAQGMFNSTSLLLRKEVESQSLNFAQTYLTNRPPKEPVRNIE